MYCISFFLNNGNPSFISNEMEVKVLEEEGKEFSRYPHTRVHYQTSRWTPRAVIG
jgi:hypothetical protein